ncbi:MAG: hypothetical protein ABFC73_13120 [Clostridiaceae bacterium]|mgnify:CR=1 FL=1
MAFFRADLSRAFSKAFVLSLLGTILCVLFGAGQDVLVRLMFHAKTWTRRLGIMDYSQKIPVPLLELLSLNT